MSDKSPQTNTPPAARVHKYWLELENSFETYETPFLLALMRSNLYIPLRDPEDPTSFHTLQEDENTEVLVLFTCRENFDAFFSQPDFSPPYAIHRGTDFFRAPPVSEECVIAIDPNMDPVVELPAKAWDQLKARAWEIHHLDTNGAENWVEMKSRANDTAMRATLGQLDLPANAVIYYFKCFSRDLETGFITASTDMFWVDVDDDLEKTRLFIANTEEKLSALLGEKASLNNIHESKNAHFKKSLSAQNLPLWPPRV